MASLYLSRAIRVMGADQKFQENHSEGRRGEERGGEGRNQSEEGGGEATCGNAECGGFEVSGGARVICIHPATGLVGCCRWI